MGEPERIISFKNYAALIAILIKEKTRINRSYAAKHNKEAALESVENIKELTQKLAEIYKRKASNRVDSLNKAITDLQIEIRWYEDHVPVDVGKGNIDGMMRATSKLRDELNTALLQVDIFG